MGMTIDDSERYLRLMLGGMEHAVKYWENRDKEESDIEQTNVEAVKTALDTMRKYQKIVQIMERTVDDGTSMYDTLQEIEEVIEDGNDNS